MPIREINVTVQQALQSRGVDATVGRFGDHQVQLGQGKPIRLDAIKSAPIPFAGFGQATKIARGRQGMERSAQAVLSALTRPGGKLAAGELLGNLKALRAHMRRMDELGQLGAVKAEERTLCAFAKGVEALSNEELSAIWQSFMSGEMDLLQTALSHEGQYRSADARAAASDLLDVQALVLKEVSDRIAKVQNMPGAQELTPLSQTFALPDAPAPAPERHEDHISQANLRTLVERGAQSATQREKSAGSFTADMQSRGLQDPALSARAIGDVMRSAELTMNISAQALLRLDDPDARFENIFHLAARGQNIKGQGYLAPRTEVESALFPELGPNPSPNERPSYGALNLEGMTGGAATDYGEVVLVFKPEVAQRSTFTVDDTFYNIPASFSRERRDAFFQKFIADYAAQNKLDADALSAQLVNPQSPLRKACEAYFDRAQKTGNISFFQYEELPELAAYASGMDPAEKTARLQGMFIAAFGNPQAAQGRTATWDSLESLLPGMKSAAVSSFARAAMNKDRTWVGLVGAQYIEAQIQGGVIPGRDIAEIRAPADSLNEAQKSALLRFAGRAGIPVTFFGEAEHSSQVQAKGANVQASDAFFRAHTQRARIDELAADVLGDPKKAIAAYLEESSTFSTLTAARKERLTQLGGAALGSALSKFQDLIANPGKINAQSDTEQGLVKNAFFAAFHSLLETKQALLDELDTLHFDNDAQKAAFTSWALSARALRPAKAPRSPDKPASPSELRLVYNAAMQTAQSLRELAERTPEPSPAELLRALADIMQKEQVAPAVEQFARDYMQANPGSEFGPDDIGTEFSRFASLGIPLLKSSPNGEALAAKLATLLNRPQQRELMGQLVKLGSLDLPGQLLVGRLGFLTLALAREAQTLAGQPPRDPAIFRGEAFLVPASTREALRELSPAFVDAVNERYPVYESFPVPSGAGLPQDEAGRRAFLTGTLLAPAPAVVLGQVDQAPKTPQEKEARDRALASVGPYMRHELSFEQGRPVHGRGHIARSYLFASALCGILEERGAQVDRNAVLLGVGGHDMGRQGGGADRWEVQSGDMLVASLRQGFGANCMGETYEGELRASIAKQSGTLESMVMDSADSLDISRVADFDMDRLSFLRDRNGQLSPEAQALRLRLHNEAVELQRLTDPYCRHKAELDALLNPDAPGASADPEQQQQKYQALMTQVNREYRAARAQSGEQLLGAMEDAIRLNPKLFPLLGKYLGLQAPAMPPGLSPAPAPGAILV